MPTEAEPVTVVEGDCLDVLRSLPDGSVDAVVTDPPYELGFMGKAWDRSGVAFDPETWKATIRVLRPGGYMLAMGGSRTYHRLAVAIEDAGFEIRDCLMWLYGTGFPKGQGCLKPAYEPILLARRPGPKVLALGVDECRVPTGDVLSGGHCTAGQQMNGGWRRPWMDDPVAVEANAARSRESVAKAEELGRYPANVVHDGSDEVMEAFAAFGEKTSGTNCVRRQEGYFGAGDVRHGGLGRAGDPQITYGDSGSVARFFYCAKASGDERDGNAHPTVKPLALMRWLVRLVCPKDGTVLDPFAGSGTTGLAAEHEGRRAVLIEQNAEYVAIIRRRLAMPGLFAGATP